MVVPSFGEETMSTLNTSTRSTGIFFLALAWDRKEGKDTGFQTPPPPHPIIPESGERERHMIVRGQHQDRLGARWRTMLQLAIFSVKERNLNWLLPQCDQLFLLLKDWDPVQPWGRGLQVRSQAGGDRKWEVLLFH